MSIKALIFDFGGVLARTPERKRRQEWEARLGLRQGEADSVVFHSDMGQKAQQGEIDEETLWRWVGQHLGLPAVELAAFRRDFWADDYLDEALIKEIRRWRAAYQTAIISNAADGLRHTLEEEYRIAGDFDLIVVSAEEKVMKPAAEIYRRTLSRLGRPAEEAIFIDDTEINVAAARKLGMKGIHVRPGLDIIVELKKLVNNINE